jgi:hypothetical protein
MGNACREGEAALAMQSLLLRHGGRALARRSSLSAHVTVVHGVRPPHGRARGRPAVLLLLLLRASREAWTAVRIASCTRFRGPRHDSSLANRSSNMLT